MHVSLLIWMLKRQIEYFLLKPSMDPSEICLYTWRFFKSNLLAVQFPTMIFYKVFSALNLESNDIYHMWEFGKIDFHHYSPMVRWYFESSFGQTEVVLILHIFLFKSTCFSGNIHKVLRFGKFGTIYRFLGDCIFHWLM